MSRTIRTGSSAGWRTIGALAVLLAIIPMAAGCSLMSGLSARGLVTPGAMTVTSPVFGAEESIPQLYTCHGPGMSPPLYWSGAPQAGTSQATRSFAIVVDDSEAPITPYVYWIVFDISPSTTAISQNLLPPGARQALNSRGKPSYDPPCPANSSHLYRFTVYALNTMLKLPRGAGLLETWSAIASHVIAIGRLTAAASP